MEVDLATMKRQSAANNAGASSRRGSWLGPSSLPSTWQARWRQLQRSLRETGRSRHFPGLRSPMWASTKRGPRELCSSRTGVLEGLSAMYPSAPGIVDHPIGTVVKLRNNTDMELTGKAIPASRRLQRRRAHFLTIEATGPSESATGFLQTLDRVSAASTCLPGLERSLVVSEERTGPSTRWATEARCRKHS